MDVAYFTVKFLHKYLTARQEFIGKWANMAYGFRAVVEERVGFRITTQYTMPGTVGAQELEKQLRKLIATDPEFGAQLWMTLADRLEYAIFLTDKQVLYDQELLANDTAYVPQEHHWWQFAAIATAFLLGLIGALTAVHFLL